MVEKLIGPMVWEIDHLESIAPAPDKGHVARHSSAESRTGKGLRSRQGKQGLCCNNYPTLLIKISIHSWNQSPLDSLAPNTISSVI